MIEGVEFIDLKTFADERGFFREIIRTANGSGSACIGQVSHSLVYHGTIKAWHAHKEQTQWNYVVNGAISVGLHDLRKNSKTYGEAMKFLAGADAPSRVYMFPPGVAHGYKCINGPMNIIYLTSGSYDINDEIRIPHDDKEIGFDWLSNDIK